ncbi:polq-1, partial [Pristionchus pacificus]
CQNGRMSHPFPQWIPNEVIEGYGEKGVHQLFGWQKEVIDGALGDGLINREGVPLQEKNIVYTAPTSAGKSLVAELLAITVLLTRRRVLFVLPYISVAREKYAHLQRILRRIDLNVAAFFGPQSSPPSGLWNAAVCTIEKANSLVNIYIQEKEMDRLGLIVIDELHMVTDSSRGGTLDGLIAKLLFSISRCGSSTRLIGMSATLIDSKRIAQWMDAELMSASNRPIELDESIMVNGIRKGIDDDRERPQLSIEHSSYPDDTDKVAGLSISSFSSQEQVLVFCSSKVEVEKTATLIAKTIDVLIKSGSPIRSLLDLRSLLNLKIEIEKRARHLDSLLLKTLPRGVAFHHAGLTSEERECIEHAFSCGAVRILVATSTLSSGVNLPARVVIIRAQTRGPAALTGTTYRQMAGRAGRLGKSEKGESIVVCGRTDVETVMKIVKGSKEEGMDRRIYEKKRDASKIVVESIGTSLCSSLYDVSSLLNRLLFPSSKTAEEYVNELVEQKLLSHDVVSSLVHPTQLGRASLASSLPPEAALFVFTDLRVASRSLALDTELHMLYLVTPVNYGVFSSVDWNVLHRVFVKLEPEERNVARLVGVTERFILRATGGMIGGEKEQRLLQIHLRFFSALALFDVVNEMPLAEVASKYSINRGSLQALQYQSATYAAMIVSFCSRLGWLYLRSLLNGFAHRLAFGIRAELTELVKIDGIDGARARGFHQAGITSMADLAQSTIRDISHVLTSVVPFDADATNDGRGEWLFGESRCTLVEAAEILRTRAHDMLRRNLIALGISPDLVKFTVKREMEKEEGGILNSGEKKKEVASQSGVKMEAKEESIDSLPESGYGTLKNEDTVGIKSVRSVILSQEEEDDLLSQSIENLSMVEEGMDEDDVMREMKDEEENHEEEVGDVMEDLETSLRRTAEVLTDSFDESIVYLNVSRRKSILEERRKSLVGRERVGTEKDSFDETIVYLNEVEKKEEKRRSILGELRRKEEEEKKRRRSMDGIKIEEKIAEIKDQSDTVSMEGDEFRTAEEYDSFLDSFRISSQRSSQGIEENPIDKSIDRSAELFDDSIFDDDDQELPTTSEEKKIEKEEEKHKKISEVRIAKKRRKSRLSLLSSSSISNLRSPTTSSPLSKQLRRERTSGIKIVDVCSSPVQWNIFIQSSRSWNSVGISIGTRIKAKSGEEVIGMAITEESRMDEDENGEDTKVFYIPLSDEAIYGNSADEEIAVTCTPLETISIGERRKVLLNLLNSLDRILLFDALKSMELIRSYFQISSLECVPVCLSYLSFLAHLRRGETPMGLHEIASSLSLVTRWQPFLSSSSPRLKAAGGAFLCSRIEFKLYSRAISLSSKESVELEMKAVAGISRMAGRGFRFARKSCDEAVKKMRKRMDEIEEETAKFTHGRRMNIESPSQVADVLFTTLNLPYPGGGGVSTRRHLPTNKMVLEQITSLHPLPSLILEYRRLKHAVSQCLVPLRESLSDVVNGDLMADFISIHTRFNLFSATGRVLSSRPNIQNVGKDPVLPGFSIRSLFVPNEGFILLSADFCQLELRVLAHMSGDEKLKRLLNDEKMDIFTRLGTEWKQTRQTVKVVCYGMIYGMGARSLAEKLECTKEEAQKMINNFFSTFPKARSYIHQTNEEGAKKGYVQTQLGRRKQFSLHGDQEYRSRQERQSINFTIQGTASEIFKSSILAVESRIQEMGGRIVMQVHDEIIVEIPKDEERRASEVIQNAMESAFPVCTVRLPVQISIGKSWAELK